MSVPCNYCMLFEMYGWSESNTPILGSGKISSLFFRPLLLDK
jgi:hypothetical protein